MQRRILRTTIVVLALLVSFSLPFSSITLAAAASVAPDYKGVIIFPSSESFQLSPECFSMNMGTKEQCDEKVGPANMHYAYIWCENMGNAKYLDTPAKKAEALADQKVAPRYFRVSLKKDQKVGKNAEENFRNATSKGETPGFVWCWDRSKTILSSYVPMDTKKIFTCSYIDDYTYSKKVAKTDVVGQAKIYVDNIAKNYEAIHKARPKAKLYVGSMELVSEAFPRVDKYLNNDVLLTKWGYLMGGLIAQKPWALDVKIRNEINKQIKAICASKKYTYVDLTKAGITNANGYILEKYDHPNGIGFEMNQAGLTKYGDWICKSMGLKTAKEMYNLK